MSIFQKKTINIVEIEPYDISFEELLVRQPNAIFPPNPQIKQLKTAHARSIDRKKITRAGTINDGLSRMLWTFSDSMDFYRL